MNKTRLISLVVLSLFALMLAPTHAIDARASYQIAHYTIDITPDSGAIDVEFSVTGIGNVSKIGCESVKLYASNGSSWRLVRSLDEDDPGMSVENSGFHANLVSVATTTGIDYKIVATVFAENDAGRDTRSETAYYTGR